MAELYFNFTKATAITALVKITSIAKEADWANCTFESCSITSAKKECLVSGSEINILKLRETLRKEGIWGGKLKSDATLKEGK